MLPSQEGLRAMGYSANESLLLLPGEQFLLEKQKLQQFEVGSKKGGRCRHEDDDFYSKGKCVGGLWYPRGDRNSERDFML